MKKTDNNKVDRGIEKLESLYTGNENVKCITTLENSLAIPLTFLIHLPQFSSVQSLSRVQFFATP